MELVYQKKRTLRDRKRQKLVAKKRRDIAKIYEGKPKIVDSIIAEATAAGNFVIDPKAPTDVDF